MYLVSIRDGTAQIIFTDPMDDRTGNPLLWSLVRMGVLVVGSSGGKRFVDAKKRCSVRTCLFGFSFPMNDYRWKLYPSVIFFPAQHTDN